MKRAALALLLASCDVPAPPASGGVVLDDAGPCPRALAVVGSDYQSTNVSVMALDGRVLAPSLLSSGSASTGLTQPLSGDVVLPGQPRAGGELLLIDRHPASVLTWVDLASGAVRAQLPVGPGFIANPRDALELGPDLAYVPRYESDARSAGAPFGGGGDLVRIDPRRPSLEERIDLAPAVRGEGVWPRPDRLVFDGRRIVVLLAAYDESFRRSAPRLVAVAPGADRFEEVLRLPASLHGCASLALSPSRERVAVSCLGEFDEAGAPTGVRSGLAVVGTGPPFELERVMPVGEVTGEPLSFGLAWIDEGRLLLSTGGQLAYEGRPARDDTLVELALGPPGAPPRARLVWRSGEPYGLGEARCFPGCGLCFVTDAERRGLVRLPIGPSELLAPSLLPAERGVGLPPRGVAGL